MNLPPRSFVQTLSYEVGDLQQGPWAMWRQDAARFWPGLEGLLSWQVLRERTGGRRYTEVFVYRDRDAFHATQTDPAVHTRVDELLERLGALVVEGSVEIHFHDVMPPPLVPGAAVGPGQG